MAGWLAYFKDMYSCRKELHKMLTEMELMYILMSRRLLDSSYLLIKPMLTGSGVARSGLDIAKLDHLSQQ